MKKSAVSPVVQFKSIRLLLGLAAANKLKLSQFDVKTAFRNGDLKEEIYISQPRGHEDGTKRVCRLQKGIYSLKQAPRNWNQKLVSVLKEFNLKQLQTDPCMFVDTKNKLLVVIYVDDGLIAAEDNGKIKKLLNHLKNKFEIKEEK